MSRAAAGAFAAVAEGIVEVAANDLERGSESENDGGEHGYGESETKDGEIEAGGGPIREEEPRHKGGDGFEYAASEGRAGGGAAGGAEGAFDEEAAGGGP